MNTGTTVLPFMH